jgi:hypothetical protein
MKNRKFANQKHAYDYLVNSMIRVNEIPVWVTLVDEGLLYYRNLDSKNELHQKIPLDDPSIDMNPVPLGFLASQSEKDISCAYVKRAPYRQWKIGLTTNNCIVTNPFKHGCSYVPAPHHIIWTKAMINTVLGKYLDPTGAQDLSRKTERPAAFGRRFGVFQDYLLFRDLGEPVGIVTKGKPELHEDFTYLTTMLNEDLNACGNC